MARLLSASCGPSLIHGASFLTGSIRSRQQTFSVPAKLNILLAKFIIWAQAGYAQTATAQISGRITDPSGAAIPIAEVNVYNVETGGARNATSNEEGIYVVPLLRPGKYDLTVRKEGFQPAALLSG